VPGAMNVAQLTGTQIATCDSPVSTCTCSQAKSYTVHRRAERFLKPTTGLGETEVVQIDLDRARPGQVQGGWTLATTVRWRGTSAPGGKAKVRAARKKLDDLRDERKKLSEDRLVASRTDGAMGSALLDTPILFRTIANAIPNAVSLPAQVSSP
jgi:hypothetical protein